MTIHAIKKSLHYARQELIELQETPDQYSTYTRRRIIHFIRHMKGELRHAEHRV